MPPEGHYLQKTQITPIFLAFAVLALPLAFAELSTIIPPAVSRPLFVAYVVLLGNTHFAITWALYLNSENLQHFASTRVRKVIYFMMPLSIMALFFAIGILGLPSSGTRVALGFALGTAAADYFHVIRQSFGVLQMFKRRAEAAFPAYLAKVDNYYFLSLFVLQLITFLNGVDNNFDGRFDPTSRSTQVMVGIATLQFARIVNGFVKAWRKPDSNKEELVAAFGYLLLQSASALLVVYRTRLYIASLAMHYVEYHVLMAPRCFKSDLDLSTRVDRAAAAFRRHKSVFYAALVFIAASVSAGPLLNMAGASVTSDSGFGWLLVNLFNGIFVAHYFVEAFLWKFRNPFYRKTLAPLYFPARGTSVKRRGPRT